MEEMRRAILFFSGVAIAIFGVGLALLLPSVLLTGIATAELERSLALEEDNARQGDTIDTVVRMRGAQDALRELRTYTAQAPRTSALLERFLSPGSGISLLSFAVKGDGQVTMSGHADTRAALLDFEETLRTSQRFYEITFPLSNITRDRDIQFSVQGKLKPEHGL